MIRHLKFSNFKSWPVADLGLAPITGLFGTNSSGKTSILQFLLMLKQTKEATDRAISLLLNGPYVELNTLRDVIHRHDITKPISIDVEIELPQELVLQDPGGKRTDFIARARQLRMVAEIQSHQAAPRARNLIYGLGDLQFALEPAKQGSDTKFQLRVQPETNFRFTRTQGRPWELPSPVKTYAFPDQARTYFQNAAFLSDLELAFEGAMDRLFYLGPLREYPQRDYLWARSRPSDVGRRGEKAVDAILAATEGGERLNLKAKSRLLPFQEMVAHWLRQLGLIHSFRVHEIAEGSNRWQAKIVTKQNGEEVLLTDVGFGVSQVLPVITLLLYVPEGSTVIVEQPEIHLHPLAQANLADLITYAATHRRVQIILESHSEHLLLRLQRRVAEQAITSDKVRLYFCDAPGGVSKLSPLDLDLYGRISNWPRDFMGDAFGETAKAEEARLKRMLRAAA